MERNRSGEPIGQGRIADGRIHPGAKILPSGNAGIRACIFIKENIARRGPAFKLVRLESCCQVRPEHEHGTGQEKKRRQNRRHDSAAYGNWSYGRRGSRARARA